VFHLDLSSLFYKIKIVYLCQLTLFEDELGKFYLKCLVECLEHTRHLVTINSCEEAVSWFRVFYRYMSSQGNYIPATSWHHIINFYLKELG
jgi:hypothetical protein